MKQGVRTDVYRVACKNGTQDGTRVQEQVDEGVNIPPGGSCRGLLVRSW